MSSPIETYIDKLAVLDAAERDAQDAVNKIHEASKILGSVVNGTEWKEIQFPGMPNMAAGRGISVRAPKLPEWPAWPDIVNKLRVYHEALTSVDEAYQGVPENYRVGVRKPPDRRGKQWGG